MTKLQGKQFRKIVDGEKWNVDMSEHLYDHIKNDYSFLFSQLQGMVTSMLYSGWWRWVPI